MPPFGLTEEELAQLQRTTALSDLQSSYASSATPSLAANAIVLAGTYPGMSAGVLYPLAASGYGPGPVAEKVWQAELSDKASRPKLGQVRRPRGVSRKDWQFYQKHKDDDGGILGSVGRGIGSGLGQVARGIGAIPGAVERASRNNPVSQALGLEATDTPGQLARTTTRAAAVTANSALEFVQGSVRSSIDQATAFAGGDFSSIEPGMNPYPQRVAEQTTGYQALQGKSTGRGFLPSLDAPAAIAQAEAARRYSPYLIGQHAWTPGRALADLVAEPDDTGFNLLSGLTDMAFALKADPSNLALDAVSQFRKANKYFTDPSVAGAYQGTRKFLIKGTPEQWRTTSDGQLVLNHIERNLRESDGTLRLMHEMPSLPIIAHDGKPLLAMMKSAVDQGGGQQAIWDLWRPYLTGPKPVIKSYANSRLLTTVPENMVHWDDLDLTTRNVDRYLVNAGASWEDRARVVDKFIQATTAPARFAAVDTFADAFGVTLRNAGVDDSTVRGWTKFFRDEYRDAAHYSDEVLSDASRLNSKFGGQVIIDGKATPVSQPFWPGEMLSRPIQLPDYREVRRAVSDYSAIVNSGAWRGGTALFDSFMGKWKLAAIARPAYIPRVVGEEQVRIIMHGDIGMNHPGQWLSWLLGSKPRDADSLTGALARGSVTASGESLSEVLKGAYYRDVSAITGHDKIFLNDWRIVSRTDEHFAQGLAEEVGHLAKERLAKGLLDQDNPTVAKVWFWSGEGKSYRLDLAENPRYTALKSDRAFADAYIDRGYESIKTVTSDHPDLLSAIRSGKIGDVPLYDAHGHATPGAIAAMQRYADEGVGPQQARIRKNIVLSPGDRAINKKKLDNLVNSASEAILIKPSNLINRSTFARQKYWQEQERLLPYMDAASREKVFSGLGAANLGKETTARFLSKHQQLNAIEASGNGFQHTINLAQAEHLSALHAVNQTKNLLYDLSERGQWSDLIRNAIPFAEAWKEVLTRWASITWENPRVLRRLQQTIQGVRGSGVFHENQFGQEVFTYPGSEFITKQLTGVPIPLQSPISGLNMIGQGLPGIGPAVSIPVAYFLPDKPSWDGVRELLYPYGSPEGGGLGGAVEELMPRWLRRFHDAAFASPESNRLFANTVMDVARYLSSTGQYDTQGPDANAEMNRLLSDAKHKARLVYLVRGAAQATLPSAPSPDWQVYDKKGNLTTLWRLTDWYEKEVDKVGPSEALDNFLDKFGTRNFLVPQSKSRTIIPNAPVTAKADAWIRDHPALRRDLPFTYALFAPSGGEFDSEAYSQSFSRGERKQLTPNEMIRAANARLANAIYRDAKEGYGPKLSDSESASLRTLKRQLLDEFPGYQDEPGGRPTRNQLIAELERATSDPRLRNNEAMKGLKEYLTARDKAIAKAKAAGLVSFDTAARAQPLRDWLRAQGTSIAERYPAFDNIFARVFSTEVD